MVSFTGIRGRIRNRLTVVQRVRDFIFGAQFSRLPEVIPIGGLGGISEVSMEIRVVVDRNGDPVIARIFNGGMDPKSVIPGKIRRLDRGFSDFISELYDAVGVFAAWDRVIRIGTTEDTRRIGVITIGERLSFGELTHTGIRAQRRGVFVFLGQIVSWLILIGYFLAFFRR